MNLLPKSHKEFSEKDYWNKFFKKRGNKAFEWYGEYLELCGQLHKYIKQKDFILITGCGNSSLSADLYDVGYENITNIDVSEVAIKQMNSINSHRTNMKFLCMDALNTSFSDEEFNVVLDKGTLDALMPDDAEETKQTIDKYFSEIKRVLKLGGRFVCISLLQSHILSKLLETFCDKSWMFRVVRCHEAEERNAENTDGPTLPVFVVVATKFKAMPQLILEVCMAGDKMQRLQSPEELKTYVKTAQDTAFVTNGLAKTSLDEDNEVSLDLMQPGVDSPRYTLYVVDQKRSQAINKYAVFIVPQGRESEWLFGTPAGRRQLQDSARFGRLVVAVLRRGHKFESLDAVKEELAHAAKMLIPYGLTGQIPFLSLGSDVGRRVKVFEGSSQFSGDFVVEDVDVEGATHRRLVFLDNQFLVQSEAKLKTIKRKNKTKLVVDFGHISLYHSFMCVGVQISRTSSTNVAVLGLGGGSLCMFLRKCYDNVKVTAVDLDSAMLEVAKNHFELQTDERLEVQIKDGLDFLKDEAKKGNHYEAVMFDMDSKDRTVGLSCPPKQFLENKVLDDVKSILTEDVKRKNKTKLVVDFGHISLYHSFMCVGVQISRTSSTNVAVLGLGGGSLCMFLRKCYDNVKVTAVDLDSAMLEVAKNHFELQTDERLEVQIKDGLDFLKDEAKKGNHYEAVMFDMDSKDRTVGLSCPPKQFLENKVLDDVKSILTEDGHFILNLVCRDVELQQSIMDTLRRHFKHLTTVKLYEEVNEIVLATNSNKLYNTDDFDKAVRELNASARQKKLVDVRCVDLKDFLQSITIIS